MDENLKREIILDNYQNPYHKNVPNKDGYEYINSNNESCIDNLDIYVKIENDIIKDICFDGEACAISTSSTSIMIKKLINKSVFDALIFINNFENMLNELDYDENLLDEAIVFNETYKQGNRKTCVTLPYIGIKKILENYKNKKED